MTRSHVAACVPLFSLGMARNVQKSAFIVFYVFCLLLLISFLSFNFDCVLKLKILAYRGWPSNCKKPETLSFFHLFLSNFPKQRKARVSAPKRQFFKRPQQNFLLSTNSSSGRPKLQSLVNSFNRTNRICEYFLGRGEVCRGSKNGLCNYSTL